MQKNPFDPKNIDILPKQAPLFPLSDALLLPGGKIQLTIFEPRYILMVRYAFRHARHIGMVRPITPGSEKDLSPTNLPALHEVGCLGRIIYFEELSDGRFRIDLKGVTRFRIVSENIHPQGFRIADIDMTAFATDLAGEFKLPDRREFLDKLKGYMNAKSLGLDWQNIEKIPDEALLISLAQSMPFSPPEKQGLLECANKQELHEMLSAIFELTAARQISDIKVN